MTVMTHHRRLPRVAPVLAYLRLELRRRLRDRRYLVLSAAFPVVLYLVYTGVLTARAGAQPDFSGIPWAAYFMVSMATYGVIGAAMTWAVNIAVERHSGWVRQLRTTPLPPAGYVLVKVLVTLLATVPAIVCVGLVGRLVNDVELSAVQWVSLLLVLAIGSLPFATFAVMLGYLLRPESAQPVSMLLFFAVSLVGGLFAPIDVLPDAIAAVGHLLPSYRLGSLGWQVLAGVPLDLSDVAVLAGWAVLFGVIAVLRYRADTQRATA